MDWDEDLDCHKQMSQKKEEPLVGPVIPSSLAGEDLPLLAKKISFSNARHPNRDHILDMPVGSHSLQVPSYRAIPEIPIRRMSNTSDVRSVKSNFSGHSTYGQTVCFFLFYLTHVGFNHEARI